MKLGRTVWRRVGSGSPTIYRGERAGADGVWAEVEHKPLDGWWLYYVRKRSPWWQRLWRSDVILVKGIADTSTQAKLFASRAIGREFGTRTRRRTRAAAVSLKELSDAVGVMTAADATLAAQWQNRSQRDGH